MIVIGQLYRLIKATVAVLRDTDRGNTCLILPAGSEVLIESTSDAGRTANIRLRRAGPLDVLRGFRRSRDLDSMLERRDGCIIEARESA